MSFDDNWAGVPNKLPESLLGKGKKIQAKIGVFDICPNKTKQSRVQEWINNNYDWNAPMSDDSSWTNINNTDAIFNHMKYYCCFLLSITPHHRP